MPSPFPEPLSPSEAASAEPAITQNQPKTGDVAGIPPSIGAPPSPSGHRSEKAMAARRANLAKARAADRDLIYRPTKRRRAASRRNLQKAIAWRRSAEGNEVARLNAFKHGLAVEQLPELLVRLGEAPEDFEKHYERVRRVLRPASKTERHLVERLARATWRRIRLFRAQARLERYIWRRLLARSGQARHSTLEEVSNCAFEISGLLLEGRRVHTEAYKLDGRIERLLAELIRARARAEKRG